MGRLFLKNKVSDQKRLYARELRKKMTVTEIILWRELRAKKLGYRFRRQYVLYGFIADFYCPFLNVVIEVDGRYHDACQWHDKKRDAILQHLGIKTLRINSERIIMELDKVLDEIKQFLTCFRIRLISQKNFHEDTVGRFIF